MGAHDMMYIYPTISSSSDGLDVEELEKNIDRVGIHNRNRSHDRDGSWCNALWRSCSYSPVFFTDEAEDTRENPPELKIWCRGKKGRGGATALTFVLCLSVYPSHGR